MKESLSHAPAVAEYKRLATARTILVIVMGTVFLSIAGLAIVVLGFIVWTVASTGEHVLLFGHVLLFWALVTLLTGSLFLLFGAVLIVGSVRRREGRSLTG